MNEFLAAVGSFLSDAVIYIAIGLVAFIGVLKCIYPVLRNSTLLNRGVYKLEKNVASGRHTAWRDSRFLGRSLRAEWQRFLTNAGQLDMRGMPCDVSEYINEETVIEKPGHSQLAEMIPSLFTSLGILGTFIGMINGLSNVNFIDAEGTIESIPLLLGGMRYAFATSVVGIACSLLFNVLYRMAVGRAYAALDSFDESFYELAMPRPLTTEVQQLCFNQDEDARMLRMAETIGNKVSSSFEMALSRALNPMNQSMDSFLRGATQEQVEGVRHIVGQFLQQLNTTLADEMTNLSQTISMVNKSQQESQRFISSTLQAAQTMVQNAMSMDEAGVSIAENVRKLAADMNQVQLNSAHDFSGMEETSRMLSEQMLSLTNSLGKMQQMVDKLCGEAEQK